MAITSTVEPKGSHFIVHCDDYDVQFDAVAVSVAAKCGDILESPSLKVSGTSAAVLGILAEDTDGTGFSRVMVRGNPSTVNGKVLNYEDAVKADIDALLEAKDIVVV